MTSASLGSRRSRLTALVRSGRYVRAYPGVYVSTEARHDPWVRLGAAAAAFPRCRFVGAEVFTIVMDEPLRVSSFTMIGPRSLSTPGVRIIRADIPTPWQEWHRGFEIVHPALAAAFLASTDQGAAIDLYLRNRGQLSLVEEAVPLTSYWGGNHRERCRIVAASRSEPWSFAEREFHAILRQARITGWRANYRVHLGSSRYFIDVAFPGAKLAIEIDGFGVHSQRQTFEQDRERQNALVLAGWKVLRFTPAALADRDNVVRQVRAALATADRSAA